MGVRIVVYSFIAAIVSLGVAMIAFEMLPIPIVFFAALIAASITAGMLVVPIFRLHGEAVRQLRGRRER